MADDPDKRNSSAGRGDVEDDGEESDNDYDNARESETRSIMSSNDLFPLQICRTSSERCIDL